VLPPQPSPAPAAQPVRAPCACGAQENTLEKVVVDAAGKSVDAVKNGKENGKAML
jgi:hypothetical protein